MTAHLYLGTIQVQRDRAPEALDALEVGRVVAEKRGNVRFLGALTEMTATAHLYLGDGKTATRMYEEEVVRAVAARREGRLAEAEKHCRAAVAYAEGQPTQAYTDLADVLVEKGEFAEAGELLDVVYAESAEGELAWLAARTVSCALAVAAGDPGARELVEQTAARHAAAGFGWRRYTDRLSEVAAQLRP
jgi:hypothetical protein